MSDKDDHRDGRQVTRARLREPGLFSLERGAMTAVCKSSKAAIKKWEKSSSLLPQRAGQEAIGSNYSTEELD